MIDQIRSVFSKEHVCTVISKEIKGIAYFLLLKAHPH